MTIDVNAWTQEEKQGVLRDIVRQVASTAPIEVAPGTSFLPIFSDPIAPRRVETVVFPAQVFFRPRRLVIFEPLVERVVRVEDAYKDRRVPGWRFWRRERACSRSVTERRVEAFSRANWLVHGLYVGQLAQWPSLGTLQGDGFGPEGALDFDGSLLSPGLSITMTVEQRGLTPAPFVAVVLGVVPKVESPRGRHALGSID